MRPQIPQRARSGAFALEPPGQRRLRIDEPVLEVGGPDVPQPPQPALLDHRAGVGEGGHLAVVEAHDRHLPAGRGPFRGLRHGLGLGDRVGERLLAQHVLARFEGGDGDLRVAVAGGADVDQLYVVPGDQRAPVGLRRRPPVPGGGGLDGRAVTSADRGQNRSHRHVEDVSRGAPPLGVGGAHERVSDHADAECRRRRRCPGLLLGLFPQGHADFLLVGGSVAAVGPAQLKPVGRYWSMLSFVTTAEYRVSEVGISISASPATPLLWPRARARSIAEAAMVGG